MSPSRILEIVMLFNRLISQRAKLKPFDGFYLYQIMRSESIYRLYVHLQARQMRCTKGMDCVIMVSSGELGSTGRHMLYSYPYVTSFLRRRFIMRVDFAKWYRFQIIGNEYVFPLYKNNQYIKYECVCTNLIISLYLIFLCFKKACFYAAVLGYRRCWPDMFLMPKPFEVNLFDGSVAHWSGLICQPGYAGIHWYRKWNPIIKQCDFVNIQRMTKRLIGNVGLCAI